MNGLIRQGDILLVPVDDDRLMRRELNKTGRKRPRKKGEDLIVAEGEATGHHHRIRTAGARFVERGGRLFLDVPSDAELEHEEHDTLAVPKGVYELQHQREYVPSAAPARVYD